MEKTIIRSFAFTLLVALAGACATARVAKTPAGNWNFSVMGTPYGEIKGELSVAANGTAWTARFKAMGSDRSFDQFLFDSKTGKITGSFYFEGNPVNFDAVLDGNAMKGSMSAGGSDFPFSGTRSAQ